MKIRGGATEGRRWGVRDEGRGKKNKNKKKTGGGRRTGEHAGCGGRLGYGIAIPYPGYRI
jgi:hypothetical protein